MAPVVWLIIGVILVVAEVLSGEFVLVMLGLAALGTALVVLAGAPTWLAAVVFAALAGGLVLGARPALKRRFLAGRELKTNVDALVGKHAVVVATVDHQGGRVRIDGDVWSARACAEADVFEADSTVLVTEISGATAIVAAQP
ncbi:NfeD family protein [Saccharopolyspora sp. 6M]|uniref:NfeD family protein n=1 Tax=Saccharopolyspora sp. 6M TaxID=2877237 RepID=UPI001CD5A3CA|nr:NfeD family protein [Saccharopolyspora sp. 6M]MCA1226349.1 NfeD family protein [Saccharopolyspora sp. 6M]